MTEQKPLVNSHQTSQVWVTEKFGTGNKTERQAETKPTGQQGKTRSKVYFFSVKDSKKTFYSGIYTHTHTPQVHIAMSSVGLLDSLNRSINAPYRKHSFTLKFITVVHSYISLFQSIPLVALPVKTQKIVTQYTETNE